MALELNGTTGVSLVQDGVVTAADLADGAVTTAKIASSTLVGTVSESSGTPTGAIIERGSNANGEYVKFADGTMICFISTSNITSGSNGNFGFTLPATFSASPVGSVISEPPDNGSTSDSFSIWGVTSATTTTTIVFRAGIPSTGIRRSTGFNIADAVWVLAIGRWY